MQNALTDETGITALFPLSPYPQACPLARSVPPTGTRLTRILEMFRVHLHSVARQVGPEELLKFAQEALRQDFQILEERRHG